MVSNNYALCGEADPSLFRRSSAVAPEKPSGVSGDGASELQVNCNFGAPTSPCLVRLLPVASPQCLFDTLGWHCMNHAS